VNKIHILSNLTAQSRLLEKNDYYALGKKQNLGESFHISDFPFLKRFHLPFFHFLCCIIRGNLSESVKVGIFRGKIFREKTFSDFATDLALVNCFDYISKHLKRKF
jgi:hypothetical protein